MRTRTQARCLALLIALAGIGSIVLAQSKPAAGKSGASPTVSVAYKIVYGRKELVLTNAKGMTLYYSSRDKGHTPSCTGACAQTWQPLTIASGKPSGVRQVKGGLSTLARPSGSEQVAYEGHPLYTYVLDTKPKDAEGAGQGSFHVATVTMSSAVRYAKPPEIVGYVGGMLVTVSTETVHGKRTRVLVAYDGKTLYYSTKDTPKASNCKGSCSKSWNPFAMVGKGAPTVPPTVTPHISLLKRKGNIYQIEYNGHPLYTYAKAPRLSDVQGASAGSFRVASLATPPAGG